MRKTCLEELLALRPADDQPETIEASIGKLRLKRTAFALQLNDAREKRRCSMLIAPVHEVNAIDGLVLELERSDLQAEELIGDLTAKLVERKRTIAEQMVRERKIRIETGFADLEARFLLFYASVVEQMMAYVSEYGDLRAEQKATDADVDQFARKHGPRGLLQGQPLPKELPQKVSDQLVHIFFDKMALPDPAITLAARLHTPMAYKGDFWVAGRDEGVSPAALKLMQQNAERSRLNVQANAERREQSLNSNGYQSRNLAPLTGR